MDLVQQMYITKSYLEKYKKEDLIAVLSIFLNNKFIKAKHIIGKKQYYHVKQEKVIQN